ncbi:hypothetical protein O3P69_017126 [Scylla paramamosain]|uniref:Group XV phospholipase A2 n=1 Tax=Scylla paramamosain TaxID=85552 RepID=A0AAW0TVQ6_SCYPA
MRLLALLLLVCQALGEVKKLRPVPPVILVPGDGGSQMEAKLDKPAVVHYVCTKKTDSWFDLWLNMESLIPGIIDCWIDNMRLVYDNTTRTTRNSPGVMTRVPGFGSTSTVEWLDPSHHYPTSYFYDVVEAMVKSPLGYVRDSTIRGAPYDFRKAPNEQKNYFKALKHMTESMYNSEGQRVVYLLHSMGGPMIWYFLANQPQSWKDEYVEGVISMAGAWGGSIKAVKVYTAGDNLGIYLINPRSIREEQRSATSLAFLLPSPDLWKEDEVLVQTPEKNYTTANFKDMFEALNLPDAYNIYLDTKNLLKDAPPPGVDLYCLYGHGINTVEKLVYQEGSFPDKPDLVFGEGDGTVNLRSAQVCESFASKQRQKVHAKAFPVMEHMAILKDVDSISYVVETLTNITQKNEEAAAKATQVEALEKQREKNMVDQHLFHILYKKKNFKRNDISSASFWKVLNMNAMPNVL